ncbi:MAG: NADPH-dependent glutamate synthase [Armatimonadetes bacterium]|nr:NADPH-dependent glutamate synthase [Armatimonadota bacterium]
MARDKVKPGRVPRQPMPEQPASERVQNFGEVTLGFSAELAQLEAERCLMCKKPTCIDGCPVSIDIPSFIQHVVDGDFEGAAAKIFESNSLAAICGRVCPQEDQCEAVCVMGKKFEPVAIGRLERFVADYVRGRGLSLAKPPTATTERRVAIIGSGPAGLTAAGELAKLGHSVTIFEALHEPGGVLVYGIPEFRLPKAIVAQEIGNLKTLGVQIETNVVIGRTILIDELFDEEGYDAVFIGTGAGLPYFLDIPGEDLNGVYSANEFLTRVNLMKAYRFPDSDTPVQVAKNVVVIGGGNTALDAARTALRLHPEKVSLLYRRSRAEMPGRNEEIEHAEDEGVVFQMLTNPVRFVDRGDGWLAGVECVRMELGEPDESGRRRPVPVEGSNFVVECETVVVAVGNGANQIVASTTPGLQTNRHGNIVAEESSGLTSREGIFAGGDIVTGAATVILAMGAGKKAAAAIHDFLQTLPPKTTEPPPLAAHLKPSSGGVLPP